MEYEAPGCHPDATDVTCLACARYNFPEGIEVNFAAEARPQYGIVEGHHTGTGDRACVVVRYKNQAGIDTTRSVVVTDPSLMVPFWAIEEFEKLHSS